MGIGDVLCLLSAIQAVADKVDGGNVAVWYDAAYPGSTAVFSMAGLNVFDPGAFGAYPPGRSIIPCRGHIMEPPIGDTCPCLYGEKQGNPIEQIYWGWGWHKLLGGHGVRLRLEPDKDAANKARDIGIHHSPYVTCTPLEVSRHNNDCNFDAWKSLLMRVDKRNIILFGCAKQEQAQLNDMVCAMHLPHHAVIITEPLPVWKSLVDMAIENYTGNSCGMWLSFASRTKTYLLQHEDPAHTHNAMWNYKPRWDCRNIVVIKI
jgi:hypothetical protein